MEELEVPTKYRVVVYKLYKQVKAKIKTKVGMSECFGNDIGVNTRMHVITYLVWPLY